MMNYSVSFVLRIKEVRGLLKVSLHNLKTGQKEEFSSFEEAWQWLERQSKQHSQGLH